MNGPFQCGTLATRENFVDRVEDRAQLKNFIRPFGQLKTIKELDYEFSRYIPWIMKMTEK